MTSGPIDASADFEGETTALGPSDEQALLKLTVIHEQEYGVAVEADFVPELRDGFGMRLHRIRREDEETRSADVERENARKR